MDSPSPRIVSLLSQAKQLAKEYRALTGRPLGITGEIAEYEAARILGLELSEVRQAGYDAIRRTGATVERLQIKGRCLVDGARPGQRLGGIRLDKEWDAVLMVLLDADLEAVEIHEASRAAVEQAVLAPGSRARNERGSLPLSKFKAIGKLIWRRTGPVTGEHGEQPPHGVQSPTSTKGQTRITGAAGNAFGRQTAPRIAKAIGATMLGSASNVTDWKGRCVVIKCARYGTTSIGVTYRMLEQLDAVVAAVQRSDGQFDLFELSPAAFEQLMRPTPAAPARRQGRSAS